MSRWILFLFVLCLFSACKEEDRRESESICEHELRPKIWIPGANYLYAKMYPVFAVNREKWDSSKFDPNLSGPGKSPWAFMGDGFRLSPAHEADLNVGLFHQNRCSIPDLFSDRPFTSHLFLYFDENGIVFNGFRFANNIDLVFPFFGEPFFLKPDGSGRIKQMLFEMGKQESGDN